MKLNISHPSNGSQKLIEIEDERKLRVFMDKRVCETRRAPRGRLDRSEPAMSANTSRLHFSVCELTEVLGLIDGC